MYIVVLLIMEIRLKDKLLTSNSLSNTLIRVLAYLIKTASEHSLAVFIERVGQCCNTFVFK